MAESNDRDPCIELTFPALETAAAILVFETCGPGAVREIRNLDTNAVLYDAPPVIFEDSRSARLLHVPLPASGAAPRRIRLRLAPYDFGSEYHEIDAVALLTVPLEALVASPPTPGPVRHRRYLPKEVTALDLHGDPRIRWASHAKASSEWSSSYTARMACGRPTIFPKGGDLSGAWLADSGDARAWLELSFPRCERAYGLIVLETCGAGAAHKLTDARGATIWQAKAEPVEGREARLLHIELEPGPPPERLRLWVSPKVRDYREIDAVALITAPFEELFEPPPPPPPKPVPGAPAGGFTRLSGVLLGASAEAPFVHATLRDRTDARACNTGGPLRLRLDTGEEVALETGATTIYGAPLVRECGGFAELSASAPWLAAALADYAPDTGADVCLETRRIRGEVRVEVAGEPSQVRLEGFRESARGAPESLRAAAISLVPLEQTSFDELGVRAFEERCRPYRSVVRPHPLRRWAFATGITAPAALALGALLLGVAGMLAAGAVALLGGALAAILALELAARVHWIPEFRAVSGRQHTDREAPFPSGGGTILGSVIFFALIATAMFVVVSLSTEPEPLALRAIASFAALFALVRLVLWQYRSAPALASALRIVLARPGRRELGAKGRFTGTLARGARFSRSETLTAISTHIGTRQRVDDKGNVYTEDQYEYHTERTVTAGGPKRFSLVLGDGAQIRTSSALRASDVAMRPVEARERSGMYASFEGAHEEGDEATLLGVVSSVEPAIEVDATHLVLGPLAELRKRVAVQIAVLVILAALVVGGPLAFLAL